MTYGPPIGKPVGKQHRKGKKKKVTLLGALFGAGKHVHDGYQKRHHPNRHKRPRAAPKRQVVKRIANNHESTRGAQMR